MFCFFSLFRQCRKPYQPGPEKGLAAISMGGVRRHRGNASQPAGDQGFQTHHTYSAWNKAKPKGFLL